MPDYIVFARRGLRPAILLTAATLLAACASKQVEQADAEPPPPPPPPAVEAEPAPESSPIRRAAPLEYVVKRGDTLWDISEYFLKDPWLWTDVWMVNPQVENPHLIYPGDKIYLVWVDGQPRLSRTPGDGPPLTGATMERMSPQVRSMPLDEAIPTIPVDAIRSFLRGPRVVGREELDDAPYIIEFGGEHILGGTGMSVYVKGVDPAEGTRYNIVRLGQTYRDPETRDILGYEAIPVADAEIRRFGKPTTARLARAGREVLIGDRLLPMENQLFEANFFPRAPRRRVDGRIISVFDGVSQIGQYQIVAINRGKKNGIEPGHVMSIYQVGDVVRDPYGSSQPSIKLPDTEAGMLMVFKTYDKMSYGLVMRATRAIHVMDRVDRPNRSG